MARSLGKTRVCALDKLWLLKFARQKGFNCHIRLMGKVIKKKSVKFGTRDYRRKEAFAPMVTAKELVWCCTRKAPRRRRRK